MDALIMSCSTGGGHNAAAEAVAEAFRYRGHNATVLDPYKLAGKDLDRKVGNGYIKIAQKTPRLFGAIYKLGDMYRNLPIHSPVYAINKLMFDKMSCYLDEHHYDVILTTHVYPAEILAYMKNSEVELPPRVFIATDYVCIPFTEEVKCDYYVTPAEALNPDFIRRGIESEKLLPFGIPVRSAFNMDLSRKEAAELLGLDPSENYLLLSGGSIGAGLIEKAIHTLAEYLDDHTGHNLIVICGNNNRLFTKLSEKYSSDSRIILIKQTDKIHLYMKACSAYISKPGGLSSTEAAVSGTPLIHMSPIPGCENNNMEFFSKNEMSIAIGNDIDKLPEAIDKLHDAEFLQGMIAAQRKIINPNGAADLCEFLEGKL